ncbi:hypothetical protein [Streptomyces sp. Isolate_45]|uniref:hypothetical protein n=1 Tax=Streptomyces sp. Isolate_45 TaxID=2950111 RepID=UPI0024820EC8|nr:hypothetical protein [Streptomyces sp. Isolate_45]
MNRDWLCRACLTAAHATLRAGEKVLLPSPLQLRILIPGAGGQGSRDLPRRSRGNPEPRLEPKPCRGADSGLCPPTIPGQLALFHARRRLGHQEWLRIAGWSWPEESDLVRAIDAIAAEQGLSGPWRQLVKRAARLALAVRDADGGRYVDDAVLEQIHYGITAGAREALRRAGLLSPLARQRPTGPRVHGCSHCGSWGVINQRLCGSCREWSHDPEHYPQGRCVRCARDLAVHRTERMCRGCLAHVRESGPHTANEPFTQLTFAAPLAHQLCRQAGELGFAPHASSGPATRYTMRRRHERRSARVDAWLVAPEQGLLFDMDRDWRRVALLDPDMLPVPTARAAALLEDFRTTFADPETGLLPETSRRTMTALACLLSWLGAEAPLKESDVRAVAAARPGCSANKITSFLKERTLLLQDPPLTVSGELHAEQPAAARRQTPAAREAALEAAVLVSVSRLPEPLSNELTVWVRVMRGTGRHQHRTVDWSRIRRYLYIATPVLTGWSTTTGSLREITTAQVKDELDRHSGARARDIHHVMLSIFRALKQEGIIFRNPMKDLSLTTPVQLPVNLPSDQLRGLLNRIPTAMGRLAVALVTIHAVKGEEVRRLLLTDYLPQRGTLAIRRGETVHTVYLDRLTRSLLNDWLDERARRWPASPNRYLLITAQSAHHPAAPPLSNCGLRAPFDQAGASPGRLWRDRVLDEARASADPVHLVRLFGIHPSTAVRYVQAAHPDKALPPIR